jgi:hypothetical protein
MAVKHNDWHSKQSNDNCFLGAKAIKLESFCLNYSKNKQNIWRLHRKNSHLSRFLILDLLLVFLLTAKTNQDVGRKILFLLHLFVFISVAAKSKKLKRKWKKIDFHRLQRKHMTYEDDEEQRIINSNNTVWVLPK